MNRSFIFLLLSAFCFSCKDLLDDKDKKIIYFPESEVIKQSVEFKDGKKHGDFREFYRNGNPKAIQHYRNDTLTDTSFFFHESGILASYQIMENNIKTGCWKKFNKAGKEYWNACFKNGLLDGKAEEYSYKSIKLLMRKTYKAGREEGKQEYYYPNGKPKCMVYFEGGFAIPGTQEWKDSGREVNNDFKINVTEKNAVLLENKLFFYVTLENPQPDDIVYEISAHDTENKISTIRRLPNNGNTHLLEYYVGKGGFVMEEVHLAAYRKTSQGNTFIKKTKFMASANNF